MTKRVCQHCGKHFEIKSSQLKYGWGKYCSMMCVYESSRNKIKKLCQYCSEEFVARPDQINQGYARFCSHFCASKSRILPAFTFEGRSHSAKTRKLLAQQKREQWQDPVYISNQIKARGIRPTKPELQLQAILNRHFPQFKYNGDFSLGVTLGGLIPDFVNVNGKKEVVEVFGEYWHSRDDKGWNYTELGRIMAFNSLGFKCLVIWDNELKDERAIIAKIKRWV